MKNISKVSILSLLALPLLTFAQDNQATDLKEQIKALKTERTAIIAQVKSGEITKEEAKALWAKKMETIRAKKEQAFNNRIKKLEERFANLAQKNPEHAEKINARLVKITNILTTQRTVLKELNSDLKAKIESGEITRADAKKIRKEKREELKKERKAERESLKEEREKIREENKEKREEAREERKEQIEKEKEELKAKVKSGEVTKEEAKEIVKEKREEFKAKREEKLNELKENNPKRYEEALKKKEAREGERKERQEERKNNRQK